MPRLTGLVVLLIPTALCLHVNIVGPNLVIKVQNALNARSSQFEAWGRAGTDSYRILHGSVEGVPGLTVNSATRAPTYSAKSVCAGGLRPSTLFAEITSPALVPGGSLRLFVVVPNVSRGIAWRRLYASNSKGGCGNIKRSRGDDYRGYVVVSELAPTIESPRLHKFRTGCELRWPRRARQ